MRGRLGDVMSIGMRPDCPPVHDGRGEPEVDRLNPKFCVTRPRGNRTKH